VYFYHLQQEIDGFKFDCEHHYEYKIRHTPGTPYWVSL
jgi:hypothetical protein